MKNPDKRAGTERVVTSGEQMMALYIADATLPASFAALGACLSYGVQCFLPVGLHRAALVR